MWKYNETSNLPGDSMYHSADELYHYGVLGMKWRHKKAQWQTINDAKKAYKQRNAKIQNTYFKSMENIEKGYKRGQMLSKKDQARELRADTLATNGWKKSKAQLKSDIARAKAKYNKDVATSKKNREAAKNILKEAKARKKAANKVYEKAAYKYAYNGPLGLPTLGIRLTEGQKQRDKIDGQRATNAMYRSISADKAYKKAKSDYKKLKKNW